jgi:hypothetical protein
MMLKLKTIVVTAFFALTPSIVFADNIPDAGTETGPGMSVLETVLWFVVGPSVIIGFITFIWALSNWRKAASKSTEVQSVN